MYVDNDRLRVELTAYRKQFLADKEAGKPRTRMNDYVGRTIIAIAENLALHPSFCGYSYIDEMVSDAIENCVRYAHNFNEEITDKAFTYLTTICWQAFVHRIKKQAKYSSFKDELVRNSLILDTMAHGSDPDNREAASEYVNYLQSLVDKRASSDVEDSNYVKPAVKKRGRKPAPKAQVTREGSDTLEELL